jgi:hypothetical protein
MPGLVTNCVASKQQKGMSQLTAVEPVKVVDEWTQYMCIVDVDELADVADASAAVGALQFRRCRRGSRYRRFGRVSFKNSTVQEMQQSQQV